MAASSLLRPRRTPPPAPDRAAEAALGFLSDRLAREFSAPVGLVDPSSGTWRARSGAPERDWPNPGHFELVPDRVTVAPPLGGSDPTWLGLPVPRPEGTLIALAGFSPGPGRIAPWGPPCPERALRAWGQVVAERLRADQAASEPSGEWPRSDPRDAPLADRLIRRLRVSDPPERFQRLVIEAVREALGVVAVAWVPRSPGEPVLVSGAVAELEPDAYRRLASAGTDAGPAWTADRPAAAPPSVLRLAVAAADADSPAGWLVAVNPLDERPFTTEVEALQTVASLIATQRNNARLYGDLKDLLFGVIRALTSAIDAKDPYTSGHSERVARIAVRIGQELGLSAHDRGDLYLMGLLHDVGKIGIQDDVLKKPGALTPEEYRLIQSHVRIGVHILSDLKKLHHLLPGVAHHHECLDGSGYPAGLSGDAIPLPARILAVADGYDAMSSSRPYRRRLSPDQIAENFRKGAGTQWDPRVVAALFACRADLERIRQKGLGESLQRAVGEALRQ